jgi:4-oxalocrotonate tautomerase
MPVVNIRILKGHRQAREDEIARRVTEVARLSKEAVRVVFEDVAADDWYVGQARVSVAGEGRQVMSGVEMIPASRRSSGGRWPRAVRRWLQVNGRSAVVSTRPLPAVQRYAR